MESAPYARPAISISLKEASSAVVASDGSDTNEPLAGVRGDASKQASGSAKRVSKAPSASGTRPGNEVGAVDGTEVDGSPESQLTKDNGQEILSSEKPVRSELDQADQTTNGLQEKSSSGVPAKKKSKTKRPRQGEQRISKAFPLHLKVFDLE
jgi:hypothetical protein